MEDEMIELYLMKQLWNRTSSDASLMPGVNIYNISTKNGNYTQVDIQGVMNNSKPSNGDNMVGSAAWMTYPISLYDTTKMNFTLQWSNFSCPLQVSNIINCSPQGGFAIVFQQESNLALGQYKNNLGEGLGYDGLSGLFAIEFDMQASVHKDQPLNQNLMINAQIRNPKTGLLTTKASGNIQYDLNPINFANFNTSGFVTNIQVSIGIIPNQINQQLLIVLILNGVPQMQISTTFEELGLEINQVYYLGFTSAQNMNRSVASGTLSVLNFKLFKTKPKFVDGQVSFLYDYTNSKGTNNSLLEIRASFYDLCMQKTTLVVYPTTSISQWLAGNETEPHILPYLYNRDTFVAGSTMPPLNKPAFYNPSSLYATPDVSFQLIILTGFSSALRMAFFYDQDYILNVTAIDYFRQQKNYNFAFIVIDNSDLITGTLSTQGYVNNNYQFTVYCYDKEFNTIAVSLSQLQLTVTSEYIRLNDTVYSNQVPLTCYAITTSYNQGTSDPTKSYSFKCTFLPNVNGTYYINSPYLPSGRSFQVSVGEADQELKILSSEYSQAIVLGDFFVNDGTTVEIYIDLRDYLNNTYNLSPDDGCVFTKSYYYQNGQKYSFLFYDDYPYLRTQIFQAGVADFKITVSCTRIEFDLQCYRCQKYIQPSSTFYYYTMTIPAYPSVYDRTLDTNIMFQQGNNFVIDLTYYDRYDNMIQSELDSTYLNNIKMQLIYGRTNRQFDMLQMQVPGKVMLYLNDSDNQFFKKLLPRTNLYYLSMQVPSQYQCNVIDKVIRKIYIAPQDKASPMEFVGDQDTTRADQFTSSIYWDKVIKAGEIARLQFTVRNSNMLQQNSWINLTTSDLLDARIQDERGINQKSTNCFIRFNYGLYEGEYFGWFYCKVAPKFSTLHLGFNGTNLTGALPFYVVSGDPSTVDRNFQQTSFLQTFTIGNGGLNITFKLSDDLLNAYDTVLMNRNQPQLGLITYNLTKLDTGVVMRYQALPMVNSTGFYRIEIDSVPIGSYRLQLNIPQPITVDLTFNSSSNKVSPIYSYVIRENATQQSSVFINSYITYRFYAKNIHNQTIDRNTDSLLLLDQCEFFLTSSNGFTIQTAFVGTFVDETGQKFYRFNTTEAIRRNGMYFTNVYFVETQQQLYVVNGTFRIQDSYDPTLSELYMVKGIDQKEFRMIRYDPAGSLANSFNASHYDARMDGTLRFKLYFRTNFNFEVVSAADFTNTQFRTAYLGYAVYANNTYVMQTNLTNISLSIRSINGEYLLIVPTSWTDQDRIEALVEGYYFIYVTGTQFGNPFTLQWMYSMFNSDNSQQLTNQALTLFVPAFVNITAGETYTFTAAVYGGVKGPAFNTLTRVFTDLQNVEIEKTSNNTPAGYIFYITVYNERAGMFTLQLSAQTPVRTINVQVSPAPLFTMQLLQSSQLSSAVTTRPRIGTSIAFNFTFVDRYGNNILQWTRQRPTLKKVQDLVQVYHQGLKPVEKFVSLMNSTTYQANFTTYYAGIVSFVLPLNNFTNATASQAHYNITFELPTNLQPTSTFSYATIRSTTQASISDTFVAGTSITLEIRLFDDYGNFLTTSVFNSSMFLVNIVPDNVCNTTSQSMTFVSYRLGIVTYTATVTKSCLYQAYVYYLNSDAGQIDIPCVNCYMRVLPAAEDHKRIEFLDMRDTAVSINNKLTLYLGKNDRNPKILLTFRDSFDNLVTSNYSDMNATFRFDIVQTATETILANGTLTSFRSFHYLQFCNESTLTQSCFNASTFAAARLRIQHFRKNTTTVMNKVFIPVTFVDNYGINYNSDDINQIASNYSYMRILNQDSIDALGYDLPVLQDRCRGDDEYPIFGRIELKSVQGFRINQTFDSISSRLSLQIVGVNSSKYTYQIISGNTQGMLIFAIFLKDDYYNDQQSATAKLFIDGVEFTNKQIVINCDRRMTYSKFFIANNGSLITRLERSSIMAGSELMIRITGADPSQIANTRFLPYDSKVFLNYTSSNLIPVNDLFLTIDDNNMLSKRIRFNQITQSGTAQLIVAGMSDLNGTFVNITPGNITADYSLVQADNFRVVAGSNSTIYIQTADRFGNLINLTNSTVDQQLFNNYSQVYYAKVNLFGQEYWNLAQCFDVVGGRVKCSVLLTEKGLYKWRVFIRGQVTQCINCFVRVVPTGKVKLSNTVMTDLSQNFYANQYFGIGKFNVIVRANYIYMKIYMKDEYENTYVNEEAITIDTMYANLRINGKDSNMTLARLHSGVGHTSQVYKITVLQTKAGLDEFSVIPEGNYNIRLSSNSLGTNSFMIFVKSSKASTGYPSVSQTTGQVVFMRFKEATYQQTAGKLQSIQLGIFDSNLFIQGFSTSQNFSFSIPLSQNSSINGDMIIGPYRGLYERFIILSRVSQSAITQQVYQQQYTIQVDGFTTGGSNKFTAIVFPDSMSRITYSNGNTNFKVTDSQGNDVDFTNDPAFNLQVVSTAQRQVPFLLNNFTINLNYTSRFGIIQTAFDPYLNFSALSIIDSTFTTISNAFNGYSPKNVIDFEKSYFTASPYYIIAGKSIQLRLFLLDSYYQQISIANNTDAQNNLFVRLLFEDGKLLRTFGNSSLTTVRNVLTLIIQVNASGYHYLQVQYYNYTIKSMYGAGFNQWIYVDVDQFTGTSQDQQWTISMTAIQRNKIFSPLTTNGSDYVSFMRTQPIYFLARLCDRWGNPFQQSSYYDYYNVGDTALSSRIKNYGDTRSLPLNLQIIWNLMVIQASDPTSRELYKNLVPSFFPLINNDAYNNYKSYKVDVYSPSNSTANVYLKVLYLVLSSQSDIDIYNSVNVSSSQRLSTRFISSSSFDNNQIKLRLNSKQLLTVQVYNNEGMPYLAETITSFTLAVTNTTTKIITNTTTKVNTTVTVPLDTVTIQILPFQNDAFYRVYFYSNTLYQDTYPLIARASIKTSITYSQTSQSVDMPLWVYPPTPPNFLNVITNTSFLAVNQTKFQPASKVTFYLTLKYNNITYQNDQQSAKQIKVYRKSSLELVTAQLFTRSIYTVSVNLEGSQTNQFRIYYQDFNGVLYPITTPEVIYFEINTSTSSKTLKQPLMLEYSQIDFNYPKSIDEDWDFEYSKMSIIPSHHYYLQAYDPTKVRLVLINNLYNNSYVIGNDFRTSILVVDNQTSRCLLSTDYNPYTDIVAYITRYDPVTKTTSRISIDVDSIYLVKKQVSQPTSYCAYYSIAVFESISQFNYDGNFTFTAKFKTFATANYTFQARISGIDFSKTKIGWYQQPSTSDQLLAEFNAYDDFNYIIYFVNVQGDYVSERTQYVKIQLKFDQQKLIQGTDYTYISRYDDRYKGYLITIKFFKAGSFQPEYYFNLQRADNIEVSNGPVLFVVREPQCMRINLLSSTGTSLSLGQLFTFVFYCFDINGNELDKNINGLSTKAVFTNLDLKNQQSFVAVESLQSGIYRVSNKFYIEGTYALRIYFNDMLIYSDNSTNYTVKSDLCKDFSGQLMYQCANNPSVCANNYYECNYINQTRCTNPSTPFLCGDKCVSNMASECCKQNDRILSDYKWCPHTNQCVNISTQPCLTIYNNTPFWCNSTQQYVKYRHQCCGDIQYNVSIINGTNVTFVRKFMVKCSNEDKCVPEDTAEYCFYSPNRSCIEMYGNEFPYLCKNDGKCRKSQNDCPSPRVCPPGYTQCPDYTCIKGTNMFSSCNKLQNCTRSLPDGSLVNYIRCPDGSCSRTYEDCPSLVSCMADQVVCPDGSCKNSELECIQTSECTADNPYRCPGFPSTCAQSRDQCPLPAIKSCGSYQSLCANGDCNTTCRKSSQYQVKDSTGLVTLSYSCSSRNMVQCPNFECRNSYIECSDILYCPLPLNYTYSPAPIICPGIKICALARSECTYSQCESTLNTILVSSSQSQAQSSQIVSMTPQMLETCYDGRCHLAGRQKQLYCMTPISCSIGYFKSGGFGEFCVSSSDTSHNMMELSILLNEYKCARGKIKCVTGECRNSADDCPSQITCPAELPILCRDGQCVKSKSLCSAVDQAIQSNLMTCYARGLLLCTSDLITCTNSLSNCPSRSSCPIGYIKCWDESCINPEKQTCPSVTTTSNKVVLSTCPDQSSFPYHCFADGSCRASLEDCPSITYCPSDRPVKCPDNSCRTSIKNCPQNTDCPSGYKFCPGEGTCVQVTQKCGTPATCTTNDPYMCEDGSCVDQPLDCEKSQYKLSVDIIQKLEDNSNYLCQNNKTFVTRSIQYCPSSSTCYGTHLVKAQNSLECFLSRDEFSVEEQIFEQENDCYLNNMYRCQDGTCSETPCDEWKGCLSNVSSYKCWDGQCVSDKKFCKIPLNGCPFYAPVRCNFTGRCVDNVTQTCDDDNVTRPLANTLCSSTYNLRFACPFEGSCTNSTYECPSSPTYCMTSYPNSQRLLYGNDQCFIGVCPEQKPYKCSNGLCVDSKENCPINPFSLQEIAYCQAQSQLFGADMKVPCGNGQCMESADQCPPLYECSLNLNTQAFFRCGDGSCRTKQSDCPQNYTICPSHIPYMCSNGMCTKTVNECTKNDNGCPWNLPYKCQYTGLCMASLSTCFNPMSQMSFLFNYPTYIPKASPTPLIAYYGVKRSYCQQRSIYTCRVGTDQPYCAAKLDFCNNTDTFCPVNKPIRCGNDCVTNYLDCKTDSCNGTERCIATGGCASVNNSCATFDGCPMEKSFRCSSVDQSCSVLPYTSFTQFYSQTCNATNRQTVAFSNIFNDCQSSDAPYSCADGSCVKDLNLCPTCVFYCSAIKKCVKNETECQLISTMSQQSNQTLLARLNQICPLSAPVRCILTGRCVWNELSCARDQQTAFKLAYNYTFTGGLMSDKCPLKTSIRCQDGRCVGSYDDCIKYQRKKYNASAAIGNPLKSPNRWGILPNFTINNSSCQVVCYDGSCRDRIENCPMIQGCYDFQKPYRCRSGFCARDQEQCSQLFGSLEYEDANTLQSQSCADSSYSDTSNQTYHRCEDGTCRPILFDEATGQNTSTCLPYMGCPSHLPYHCSTGDCVSSMDECAGVSECPSETPFRCKSFQCVSQMSDCERPYSSYQALQLDRTVNLLEDSWINFAYSTTGVVLGKLLLPSNSMTLQSTSLSSQDPTQDFQQLITQQIRIYNVPDSVLELAINRIPSTRVDYIRRIYPLSIQGYLSRGLSYLSPVVKVESSSDVDVDKAFIYFKIDSESFPKVLKMEEDICLGKLQNLDQIYQGQSIWQCQQREFNSTEDGYLQFTIHDFGIYAVIINPNPDIADQSECGFICQNHILILVIEIMCLTFLILLVYAFCITKRNKPQPKSKVQYSDSRRQSSFFQGRPGDMYSSSARPSYLSPILNEILDRFYTPELVKETDIDKLKEQLESLDPQDPPLMPGQVVMLLSSHHDTQKKQIDVLKNQLQEYQEKEINNLALIKAIFEKNKILQAQMDLEKELKSQSNVPATKSVKSRRPKKVKEDPSIMTEYNNIDAYLAQSMNRANFQNQSENQRQMSQATFENYPAGLKDTSMMHHLDQRDQRARLADQSMQSIPIQQIYGGQMIISESTRDLINKNYQSTSNLQTAAQINDRNMLIRDDDFEEFQLNEYRKARGETFDEQLHSIEEEKDADEQSLLNRKYKMRAAAMNDNDAQDFSDIRENMTQGLDIGLLSKTLNSLFAVPNNRKKGDSASGEKDTKGFNMFMASEGISGTKSGNLIKSKNNDQDVSRKYKDIVNQKAANYSGDLNSSQILNQSMSSSHKGGNINSNESPDTKSKKSKRSEKSNKHSNKK